MREKNIYTLRIKTIFNSIQPPAELLYYSSSMSVSDHLRLGRCCWREQVNTSGSSRPCVGHSGKQEYFFFPHSLTLYPNSLVYLFSFPWDLLMNENVHTHTYVAEYMSAFVYVYIYIYYVCVCGAHTHDGTRVRVEYLLASTQNPSKVPR